MTRVLVAEDSAVTREYLVYLLGQDPELEVVGTARDGVEAVEQAVLLKPDVIVMDIHMPRMNGYEATREVMRRAPTPVVMVSATFTGGEPASIVEALRAGAVILLVKPGGMDDPDQAEMARQFVETVKRMARLEVS